MKRFPRSAFFLILVTLAGCGYSLVGRGSNIPEEVRRVQLVPLENATPRSQVDQILTRALTTELVNRRRFEVLSSAEGSDAVLAGKVTSFTLSPVTFDSEGRATEYEIAIVVSVTFKQVGTEVLLYGNDNYLFRSSYEVQASELGFQDRETPAIEATAKGKTVEERARRRKETSQPLLEALHLWLLSTRTTVADGGALAKAIDYSLRRWPAIARYVTNGFYPIDNNPVENAIRPIAIGKKNWLFAGSEAAGQRAAAIQSLLETARLNGIEPMAWLIDTLEKLPSWPNSRIDELLPLKKRE